MNVLNVAAMARPQRTTSASARMGFTPPPAAGSAIHVYPMRVCRLKRAWQAAVLGVRSLRSTRKGGDACIREGGTGRPDERVGGRPDAPYGWREPWTEVELGSLVPKQPDDYDYKIKCGEGGYVPVVLVPRITAFIDPVEPEETGLGDPH